MRFSFSILALVCLTFILISCEKEGKRIQFTKDDLLNNYWLQKDSLTILVPDSILIFKEVIITDEKYFFTSNDSFRIEGDVLSKSSDKGVYKYDNEKKEIEFFGNSPIIIIDGIGVSVSEFIPKWKWSIVSFEDEVLTVYVKNYNFQTNGYSTVGARVSYLKK